MTLPEFIMWQYYYGVEPWDAMDTVVASLGKGSAQAAPIFSAFDETAEQTETRILKEMGIS